MKDMSEENMRRVNAYGDAEDLAAETTDQMRILDQLACCFASLVDDAHAPNADKVPQDTRDIAQQALTRLLGRAKRLGVGAEALAILNVVRDG